MLTTVWRLLVRVDADALQAVLADWLRSRLPVSLPAGRPGRRVIAVDGKVLRGAGLPDGRQVHLLSAYDTADGLVLAQVQIAAKSNEIPAFAPLLEQVAARLGGLTAWCSSPTRCIRSGRPRPGGRQLLGGHLYVPVKANQPTLFAQLKHLPWAEVPVGDRTPRPGHGRRETRTVKALTVRTPAASASRTPNRPYGSPGPARWQASVRVLGNTEGTPASSGRGRIVRCVFHLTVQRRSGSGVQSAPTGTFGAGSSVGRQ